MLPSNGPRLAVFIPGRKFCIWLWAHTEPPVVPGGVGWFSSEMGAVVTPFCSAVEFPCERPDIPGPRLPPWDATGEES